jgi:acetamidase/formamidase
MSRLVGCLHLHHKDAALSSQLLRTGGQIGNNDSADDVLNVDLTQVHYLSGPFEIEGAEPGDLLVVEVGL